VRGRTAGQTAPVRRRIAAAILGALGLLAAPAAAAAQVPPDDVVPPPSRAVPPPSRAVGKPWHGRLLHGVRLPESGPGFRSYDAIRHRRPDREWRRWGTQTLVDVVAVVCASYAADHPDAPPVLVADLSRPQGGAFGRRFGGLGHASHQNGLDVDVMYPRRDRRLTGARRPWQVDRVLAQDLVDHFVDAGAQKLFVGTHLGLKGPRRIVQAMPFHDDHVHVRIPKPARGR
jgi:murein endopeptidase